MSELVKMTADEWCAAYDVAVLDPDGWDRSRFEESWAEMLTREEFLRRIATSTVIARSNAFDKLWDAVDEVAGA